MNPAGLINTQQPINPAHPLARGLRAMWLTIPQWYGGNKWYDLSGRNHGLLTGMTAGFGWRETTRPGGYGHLTFDGSGDTVTLTAPGLSALPAFTLSVWFRSTNGSQTNKGIAGNWNTNDGYMLWLDTSGRAALPIAAAAHLAGTTDIRGGAWFHLCGTYDGTTSRIYVNGKQENSQTEGGPSAQNAFQIGRYGAGATFVAAQMDDICVRGCALSAVEVWALYNESRLGYPGLLRRMEWPLVGAEAAVTGPIGASVRHLGLGLHGGNQSVRRISWGSH